MARRADFPVDMDASGMAAAISLVINGSDEEIFRNIKYLPNMFVYRKVLNAFMEDK